MKLPSPPSQAEVTEREQRPGGLLSSGRPLNHQVNFKRRQASCGQRDIIGGIE